MKFQLDKYIAGLCFYRTAFTVQKFGLKSSAFRPKPFTQIAPKSYRHNAVPNRFSSRFSTSLTNGPRLPSPPKAGTHSPFGKRSHTRAHTAKQGRFRWGRYYYPRTVSHVSETLRGQGVERRTLPLWGLGRGCSQRTQKAFGTAMRMMRVAVPRRRGPAGLRRPTPPAERTVLAPISPRVQLCLRRPAFSLRLYPRSMTFAQNRPS